MPIYEAEFLGDAKPIRKSKPTSKKQKLEENKQVATPVETPMEKPVKVRTQKPKKVKFVADIPPPSPVSTVNETPIMEPKPKRQKKEKKVVATTPPPSPVSTVDETPVVDQKLKRVTKKKVPVQKPTIIIDGAAAGDPPTWFKNYLLDEARRRNEDKSKSERSPISEVKKTATETAHKKWNDGLTRDRVNNEVSSHMNRLYQQIHGRR